MEVAHVCGGYGCARSRARPMALAYGRISVASATRYSMVATLIAVASRRTGIADGVDA